jgi:hypothetical protein
MMKKITKKINWSLLFLMVLTLISCGAQDSDLADRYQATLDLDKKHYDAVISSLGDCSQFFRENRQRCLLDLGAAYMAKGGFKLSSIGQEMLALEQSKTTEDALSKDITKLLIEKTTNAFVAKGIDVINQLLEEADPNLKNRLCTKSSYTNYGRFVAQGCLASNPILLRDLLRDEAENSTSRKSDVAVSLEDIVNYRKTLTTVAPEISIEEVVDIINKEDPPNDKDKNNNNINDALDATTCVLDAYNSGSFVDNDCTVKNATPAQLATNAFSNSGKSFLNDIYSVRVIISDGATNSNTFYRLAQQIQNSTEITTINTEGFCKADLSACDESAVDGTTCFSCPSFEEGATKTKTIDDSIDQTLNDDDSFKALASTLESTGDDKTDAQKEQELRNKICGGSASTPTTTVNLGKCTLKDGKVYIPPSIAIEYFQSKD